MGDIEELKQLVAQQAKNTADLIAEMARMRAAAPAGRGAAPPMFQIQEQWQQQQEVTRYQSWVCHSEKVTKSKSLKTRMKAVSKNG